MKRSRTLTLASVSLVVLMSALVMLAAGCGGKKGGTATNQIGFQISEPMYALVSGTVVDVTPGEPYNKVEVKLQDFKDPTGMKGNPYKDKTIKKGTILTINWGMPPQPEVGKTYLLPCEFSQESGVIKITLKGTPKS